jgi:hypothetical protein
MFRQRVTEAFGEPLGHALRLFRVRADELGDRVQRVEQEVWIHLRAQRLELRFGQQALQSLLAQVERALFCFEVQGVEAVFQMFADGIEERELRGRGSAGLVAGGDFDAVVSPVRAADVHRRERRERRRSASGYPPRIDPQGFPQAGERRFYELLRHFGSAVRVVEERMCITGPFEDHPVHEVAENPEQPRCRQHRGGDCERDEKLA